MTKIIFNLSELGHPGLEAEEVSTKRLIHATFDAMVLMSAFLEKIIDDKSELQILKNDLTIRLMKGSDGIKITKSEIVV